MKSANADRSRTSEVWAARQRRPTYLMVGRSCRSAHSLWEHAKPLRPGTFRAPKHVLRIIACQECRHFCRPAPICARPKRTRMSALHAFLNSGSKTAIALPVILGLFIEQYLSFFEPIAGFPIISLMRQRNSHAIHGLREKGRQLEGRGQGLDCLRIKAVFVLNPA